MVHVVLSPCAARQAGTLQAHASAFFVAFVRSPSFARRRPFSSSPRPPSFPVLALPPLRSAPVPCVSCTRCRTRSSPPPRRSRRRSPPARAPRAPRPFVKTSAPSGESTRVRARSMRRARARRRLQTNERANATQRRSAHRSNVSGGAPRPGARRGAAVVLGTRQKSSSATFRVGSLPSQRPGPGKASTGTRERERDGEGVRGGERDA